MEKRKWNCGEQRLMRDSSWPDCVSLSFEKDRAYGFSWPQRNYRCSFCNKEFKSAQALGGHMNVHRRDRARMKLSPNSWESSSPGITSNSSNPNPNFFPFLSSSAPPKFSSYNMPPSQKSFTTPAAAHLHQENAPVTVDPHDIVAICRGDRENKNKEPAVELTARRKEARVWQTSEFHRLDLNLNLDLNQDGREDLDLELRLGFN